MIVTEWASGFPEFVTLQVSVCPEFDTLQVSVCSEFVTLQASVCPEFVTPQASVCPEFVTLQAPVNLEFVTEQVSVFPFWELLTQLQLCELVQLLLSDADHQLGQGTPGCNSSFNPGRWPCLSMHRLIVLLTTVQITFYLIEYRT